MSHLYFLVPDLELTRKVVDELRQLGMTEEDIGVIARADVDLEDLPEADMAETSDLKPALKRGIAVGGAGGLLAGLIVTIVPGGFALGGLALAAATVGGGAFGAWISTLIGVSVPNSEIEEFRQAVRDGQILMLVDAAGPRHEEIREAIVRHHPEVVFGGEEHLLPRVS